MSSSLLSTPYDTPVDSNTPCDTPLGTPSASPLQRAVDRKAIPRAQDVKLILSDVDGTLFTTSHELHERTLNAIRHIRQTQPDLPIIPVTGKQRVSCAGLIKDLDLAEFPAACMHGAVIYDKDGGVEQSWTLDPKFVLGVTELMKSRNKTTMLYVNDWVAMASLESGGKTDWEAVSRGFDPCVKDARETDFLNRVEKGEEKIGKIFLPMDEELVPEFLTLLRTEFPLIPFKTTRALPYIIEIVAENVDKSAAMAYFCAKYNVNAENVMTFGDGENDVGMLTAAGFGVSMGNAMEAPRLAADYATGTNDEGGVGQFLDQVFRPELNHKEGGDDVESPYLLPVEHLKSLDQTIPHQPCVEIVDL